MTSTSNRGNFPAASIAAALAATLAAFGAPAMAADAAPQGDQVVVPQVDRRDIQPPHFPSNDFAIGAFVGTYATQNFGSSFVAGLRLGYHLTEDFFAEGVYGQTKISDELFSQVFPGSILPGQSNKLSYYNLSVGYNVLPGEVFIGSKRARPAALYLIGGVGSTEVGDQRRPTFNVGAGYRVFLADWAALQIDVRDHIFSLDLLGKRQSTQNLEFTGGFTVFF